MARHEQLPMTAVRYNRILRGHTVGRRLYSTTVKYDFLTIFFFRKQWKYIVIGTNSGLANHNNRDWMPVSRN